MMIGNSKGKTSHYSAQSLVEVTIGIVVFAVVVIALIDLAIVLYGVSRNDSICRNAARASASGNPGDAEHRAQAIIDQANFHRSGSMSYIRLVLPVVTNITSEPELQRDPETDKMFSRGGLVTGSASVTTEVEIKPIAVHLILTHGMPLKFRSQQTFPISYVMPAN